MIPIRYGALSRLLKGGLLALGFAASAQADPIRILALGDSLTSGYGLAQGDGLVPQLETWMHNHGAAVSIINAGVSGDTSAGGAARLGWVLTPEIDMVMVALGGNDMLRGLPPDETRGNLDQILTEIAARNLPVLLVGIPASGNFGSNYKMQFDAIFPDLATRHSIALYPNLLETLTDTGDAASMRRTLLQPDGLHPNRDGVARIVSALGPELLHLVEHTKK